MFLSTYICASTYRSLQASPAVGFESSAKMQHHTITAIARQRFIWNRALTARPTYLSCATVFPKYCAIISPLRRISAGLPHSTKMPTYTVPSTRLNFKPTAFLCHQQIRRDLKPGDHISKPYDKKNKDTVKNKTKKLSKDDKKWILVDFAEILYHGWFVFWHML